MDITKALQTLRPGASWSISGENYEDLRRAYYTLNAQSARAGDVLSRFVGGVYVDRSTIGQKGGSVPYTPVSLRDQKRALKAIENYVFAPNAFAASSSIYNSLAKRGLELKNALANDIKELGLNYTINQIGSMFTLFFTDKAVNNFSDAKTSDTALFGKYFKGMLDKGIYLPPSQYESWFLSAALGDSEYDQIITASKATLRSL